MATPAPNSTAASALPAAGGTSEQTLSNYIGPYVTNMLGKAQAISNEPYQVYQGPMTAGTSNLQNKVFQGLGNLSFPGNLGQSFSSGMGGQPAVMPQQGGGPVSAGPGAMPPMGNMIYTSGPQNSTGYLSFPPEPQGIAGLTPPQTSQQPSNIAQSYMNPYLESVLAPQMEEMRRQSKLSQAIMESEAARNLLSEQNKTVGQGYASAYDKAMGQFNTEQGQSKDLVNMLANAGAAERGIEQEGITADYNEFLAQRDDPMKKTQYLQSMLQGLPISTVTNTPLPKSGIGQLVEAFGGMTQLEDALKKLKLG